MTSDVWTTQSAEAHRAVAGRGRDRLAAYPLAVGDHVGRVVEAGTGDRAVVCLHGAGSRADRWAAALPGLALAGLHVYALDFPGHGFAAKPTAFEYTAPRFAQWVVDAISSLGLSEVTLMGTSLGGHVAGLIATEHTSLVRDLVCIGSTGITEFPTELQRPPEVVADASVEGIRRKLALLVADQSQVTDLWVREESMINSSPGASQALLAVASYLNDGTNHHLVGERLATQQFEHPVLFVWGADDQWTPPGLGEAAQGAVPGSVLRLMPGCGHAPYFENPDLFVDIVSRHFDLTPST